MTERTASLINIPSLGRVERAGLAVTGLLMVVTYFLGYRDLAIGVAAGGILFTANFVKSL